MEPTRHVFDLTETYTDAGPGNEAYLVVIVTDEGVIMDCVLGGEVVATVGMMADEWSDAILNGVI